MRARPGLNAPSKGGVIRTYREPTTQPVVKIDITSPAPANFEPTQTFQIDLDLVSYVYGSVGGRTVTYISDDPAIVTVSASGLVTAVADGSTTVRVRCEGAPEETLSFQVTTPQVAVHHVTVSPTSATILDTTTVTLTANPQSSASSTLPGKVATWTSSSTTVATVASSGSLTGVVTGVTVGSTNITATVDSVPSTTVPITVNATASTGSTDKLGINHPNMPSHFVPLIGRFYLSSTQVSGQNGSRSGTFDPYYVGGSEGFDANSQIERISIGTEPTRPFQTSIQSLTGVSSNSLNVGWFKLSAGEPKEVAYGRCWTKGFTPSSTFYPTQCRKKWRTWYHHIVFKWHPQMPAIGTSGKVNFYSGALETSPGGNLSGQTNAPQPLWQPRFGDSLSTTAPVTSYAANMQGSKDNNLGGANPGQVINGVLWQQGISRFQLPIVRDQWVSVENIVTCSTSTGTTFQRDGSWYIWYSIYDAATKIWSTPVSVLSATGLEMHANQATINTGRSYWNILQTEFQYAATSSNNTYQGVDAGAYVALDFLAGSETT